MGPFSIVLYTNMVVSSRGCKPRINESVATLPPFQIQTVPKRKDYIYQRIREDLKETRSIKGAYSGKAVIKFADTNFLHTRGN